MYLDHGLIDGSLGFSTIVIIVWNLIITKCWFLLWVTIFILLFRIRIGMRFGDIMKGILQLNTVSGSFSTCVLMFEFSLVLDQTVSMGTWRGRLVWLGMGKNKLWVRGEIAEWWLNHSLGIFVIYQHTR